MLRSSVNENKFSVNFIVEKLWKNIKINFNLINLNRGVKRWKFFVIIVMKICQNVKEWKIICLATKKSWESDIAIMQKCLIKCRNKQCEADNKLYSKVQNGKLVFFVKRTKSMTEIIKEKALDGFKIVFLAVMVGVFAGVCRNNVDY